MRCVKSRLNRDYEEKFFQNKMSDAGGTLASRIIYTEGGETYDGPYILNEVEKVPNIQKPHAYNWHLLKDKDTQSFQDPIKTSASTNII